MTYVVTWEAGPSRILGADSLEEAQDRVAWPVVPLVQALEAEYDSDAHLSPVLVYHPEEGLEEALPRLNLPAFHELEDQGFKVGVDTLFVDIDLPGHRAWASPAEARETLERVRNLPPFDRAGLYDTKHGWRAVFQTSLHVPLAKVPDVMGQPRERHGVPPYGLLAELQAVLDGAGIDHVVDRSCRDRNRCYRAPYVMRDGKPTDPAFIDLSPLEEGLTLPVKDLLEAAKPAARKASAADVDLYRPDEEPLSALVWSSLGITGHIRRRMPGSAGAPGLEAAIRKQVAWFGPSERNEATHHAVTLILDLIYQTETKSPQEAANIVYWALAPCLEHAHEQGISSTDHEEALDELWSMIERHSGVCVARLEERQEARARAAETRARMARALSGGEPESAPEHATLTERCTYCTWEGEDAGGTCPECDDPTEPIPSADVSDDLPLYPIIAWGSNYFVLDARDERRPRYFPPTGNPNVVWKYLLDGCGSDMAVEGEGPLALRLHNQDGKERGFKHVYLDYGASATDVIVAHGRALPHLDVENFQLELPGATAVDVRPLRDPEVEGWLNLIGGDDVDGLLDWLATCSRLDRPTCALYLQGPPGAGKSFFAMCVASVFGRGFVDFVESTSRFNARLAQSPVIFLDEKATARDRIDVSGMFRSLVANTEHRVEAKGKDMMTIRGACRVVIASNNANALPLIGQHTEDDMTAIASRIRWIGMDEGAVQYLEDLGGREGTLDWVGPAGAPGRFARHVRWLELNRDVVPGKRFLVEGRLREYHELLALTDERLSVLNAIVRAVSAGTGGKKAAVLDDGDAIIHVRGLKNQWSVLTKERQAKTQREIATALGALSGVRQERGKGDFRDKSVYRLPGRYLELAANALGHATWDIKKRLEASRKEES